MDEEDDEELVAVVDVDAEEEADLRLVIIERSLGILHLRTGLEGGLPAAEARSRCVVAKNSSRMPVEAWI